jgi:GH24 family phage-related lysozyme (muramidase)
VSRHRSRLFRLLAAVLATAALTAVPVTATTTPAFAATGCGAVGGDLPKWDPSFPGETPTQPDPPQMTPEEIKAFVANHESKNGVKGDPHVYINAQGHPTVGVGFNLDRPDAAGLLTNVGADYNAVRNGTQNLTAFQIVTLFEADFNAAVATVQKVFGTNWDTYLPNRQAVLIDLAYSLGSDQFSLQTLLIGAIKGGSWQLAAAQISKALAASQAKQFAGDDAEVMRNGASCKDIASVPGHDSTDSGGSGSGGSTDYGNGIHADLPNDPEAGGGGGIKVYQGITLCSIETVSAYYEDHWVTITTIDCHA